MNLAHMLADLGRGEVNPKGKMGSQSRMDESSLLGPGLHMGMVLEAR